jgi:hypothetical protein
MLGVISRRLSDHALYVVRCRRLRLLPIRMGVSRRTNPSADTLKADLTAMFDAMLRDVECPTGKHVKSSGALTFEASELGPNISPMIVFVSSRKAPAWMSFWLAAGEPHCVASLSLADPMVSCGATTIENVLPLTCRTTSATVEFWEFRPAAADAPPFSARAKDEPDAADDAPPSPLAPIVAWASPSGTAAAGATAALAPALAPTVP